MFRKAIEVALITHVLTGSGGVIEVLNPIKVITMYDLTTTDGIKKSASLMGAAAIAACLVPGGFLTVPLSMFLASVMSRPSTTEEQTKAVTQIIGEAKKQGWKEIEVKVDKKIGGKIVANGYGEISGYYGNSVTVKCKC